jgi:hypothetical protein
MILVLIFLIRSLYSNYAFPKMHSYESRFPKSPDANLSFNYGTENKTSYQ